MGIDPDDALVKIGMVVMPGETRTIRGHGHCSTGHEGWVLVTLTAEGLCSKEELLGVTEG